MLGKKNVNLFLFCKMNYIFAQQVVYFIFYVKFFYHL